MPSPPAASRGSNRAGHLGRKWGTSSLSRVCPGSPRFPRVLHCRTKKLTNGKNSLGAKKFWRASCFPPRGCYSQQPTTEQDYGAGLRNRSVTDTSNIKGSHLAVSVRRPCLSAVARKGACSLRVIASKPATIHVAAGEHDKPVLCSSLQHRVQSGQGSLETVVAQRKVKGGGKTPTLEYRAGQTPIG